MLISLTSDGFPTIKHGSNDFVVFQNNCSLNILQDLPAWDIDFISAVKRFVRRGVGARHILGNSGSGRHIRGRSGGVTV